MMEAMRRTKESSKNQEGKGGSAEEGLSLAELGGELHLYLLSNR